MSTKRENYPSEVLLDVIELLLEYDLSLPEVNNLAADLLGEYGEHLQDRNERAWEQGQEHDTESADRLYRETLIAAGRGHLLK